MIRHERVSKLFAIAIVAMLAMVSCVVIIGDDEADATSSYEITMYVGDTFSYAPTTNLTSDIVPSGTAMTTAYTGGTASGFLEWTNNTLAGTPTSAGAYAATLTATWVEGSLQQTATQTVNITVHAHTVFTSSTSTFAIAGTAWTHSPAATGAGAITYSSPVIPADISDWAIWDATNQCFSGTPTSGEDGTYSLQITATAADSAESKTQTITLSVFSNLAISSGDSIQTYVGANISYDITTNFDAVEGAVITKTATLTNVSGVSTLALSGATVSGAFTEAANTSSSPWYTDYTMVVGASGTLNGANLTIASKTVNIRVYSTLEFTNVPSSSNVSAGSATNDPLSVVIAAEVGGATSIVYSWGDGTRTVVTPNQSDAATYSMAHTYASEGSYVVTITATNTQGSTNTYIMYDAGDGGWSIASASDAVNDIFAQHGYLFLILGVLGILVLVIGIVKVRNPYVLAIGALLIVAAMAVYLLEITPIADMLGITGGTGGTGGA